MKRGDTIEWKINKIPPHLVVFDSENNPLHGNQVAYYFSNTNLLMSLGETATTIIPDDAPFGTYPFYCAAHRGAGMSGKIIVDP